VGGVLDDLTVEHSVVLESFYSWSSHGGAEALYCHGWQRRCHLGAL